MSIWVHFKRHGWNRNGGAVSKGNVTNNTVTTAMLRRTWFRQLIGQLFFDVGDLRRVTSLKSLQLMNIPLLISTLLKKSWCAYMESKDQGVRFSVEVSLTGQKVQSEETIVSPTFSNFKIRRKLPHDIFVGVSQWSIWFNAVGTALALGILVDHFHAIFVPEKWEKASVITIIWWCVQMLGVNREWCITWTFQEGLQIIPKIR